MNLFSLVLLVEVAKSCVSVVAAGNITYHSFNPIVHDEGGGGVNLTPPPPVGIF